MSGTEYVTDVAYTEGFYSHLGPAWLNYIAAINGVRPRPLADGFTWCELGCGMGLSAALLAALHPGGRFHAVDLLERHVRFARALADEGSVANLAIHQATFREALSMELPQFDFIVLHGVWSWVPAAAREDALAFLRRKLKPGGLAMVSYNAMPGWANILPLREMMQAYVGALDGDSIERARDALAYLKFLLDNGASYFAANPAAAMYVQDILKMDLRYIVHEYITPHGDAFYFAQVERAMAELGLAYVGDMIVQQNYPQLVVKEAFRAFLQTAPSRSIFETHRDFIANTHFRNDLYVADRGPRSSALEDAALYDTIRFALTELPELIPLQGSDGPLKFDLAPEAERVRAIFDVLAEAPASIEQIHRATNAAKPVADTVRFMLNLVIAGRITVAPAQDSPAPGWSRLNRALLERALASSEAVAVRVGCPRLGTALEIPLAYAVAIELCADCASEQDAGLQGAARLARYGRALKLDGGPGDRGQLGEARTREHFADMWRRMRDPLSREGRYLRLLGLLAS